MFAIALVGDEPGNNPAVAKANVGGLLPPGIAKFNRFSISSTTLLHCLQSTTAEANCNNI